MVCYDLPDYFYFLKYLGEYLLYIVLVSWFLQKNDNISAYKWQYIWGEYVFSSQSSKWKLEVTGLNQVLEFIFIYI
jgi:hypothetical protein